MNKAWLGASFLAGVTAGIFASKQYFETRYRDMAEAEIESVKEAFRKDRPAPVKKKKPEKKEDPEAKTGIAKYTNYKDVLDGAYKKESKASVADEEPVMTGKEPYVIPPDSFGEDMEYEQISLTYYADGTLAGDDDKPMSADEIQKTVGQGSLTRFGEYEDDSVFVRNETLKCEYEILLDHRTYRDMMKAVSPRL